ncbi:MAG: hypothetical protein QXF40_05135 [Metallosphaera sp.]
MSPKTRPTRIKVSFTLDSFLYHGIVMISKLLQKEQRQIINEALIEYLKNPLDKYYTKNSHRYKKVLKVDVHVIESIQSLARQRNVPTSIIVRTALALYIAKRAKELGIEAV